MRLLIIFLFLSFSQNSFSQNVNTNDLDNYLKIYINMSGMLGVDLKYVYNQKIKMEYINAKDLFKLDNAIALAWGMNKDDEVTIMVDRTQWLRLSLMEKMSVMFHELSHDILNAEHDDSNENNLMHTVNLPKTQQELINQTAVLLSEYFPNQVKYNLKFKNKGSSTEFKKN